MNGTATRRGPGQDHRFRDFAVSGWTRLVEDGRGHPGLNDSSAGPAGAGGAP
jgi:hypothetical protein